MKQDAIYTQTITKYLSALEKGDVMGILDLFEKDAEVESPLYGLRTAHDFYTSLAADTKASKIIRKEVFNNGHLVYAAFFNYAWTLSSGEEVNFDCVDLFYFQLNGKIKKLHIIYDTQQTRSAFDELS